MTDGRFSGGTHGFMVAHVAPEAATGGAIGLVRTGDAITIDVATQQLTLDVPQAELEARRAAQVPARSAQVPARSAMAWGVFAKYAETVRSASLGAVTTTTTAPGLPQTATAAAAPVP